MKVGARVAHFLERGAEQRARGGEGEGVGEGEGEGEGKDEGDVSCSLLEHEAGVLLALAALGPVDTGWLRVGVA